MNINKVITALVELEAKGCHSVVFDYGNGILRVKIYSGEEWTGKIVYKGTITEGERAEMEKLLNLIETLSNRVITTVFQCYIREFVRGEKSGDWRTTQPVFEFGENSTYEMLTDGSGYYLTDLENGLQYFVDMKQESKL